MTNIVPFVEQISSIESLEGHINALGNDEPHKAYLIGIAIAKLADRVKKNHNEGFRKYYDVNKELPGGFECKVSNRKSYEFSEDQVWSQIKATLEAREALLKSATELAEKGGTFTDPNTGEIVSPVTAKWTEVYAVSKK